MNVSSRNFTKQQKHHQFILVKNKRHDRRTPDVNNLWIQNNIIMGETPFLIKTLFIYLIETVSYTHTPGELGI